MQILPVPKIVRGLSQLPGDCAANRLDLFKPLLDLRFEFGLIVHGFSANSFCKVDKCAVLNGLDCADGFVQYACDLFIFPAFQILQ